MLLENGADHNLRSRNETPLYQAWFRSLCDTFGVDEWGSEGCKTAVRPLRQCPCEKSPRRDTVAGGIEMEKRRYCPTVPVWCREFIVVVSCVYLLASLYILLTAYW